MVCDQLSPDGRHLLAHGSRVALGRFLPSDLDAVHAYASDPAVTRFQTWGPNDLAATHRFLEETLVPDPAKLTTAVIHNSTVIGVASVWVTSAADRNGELGYALASEFWGRGLATEAARLLLTLGRERLGLARIAATCDVDNVASARVLDKIGMRREGTLRSFRLVDGMRRDHDVFAYYIPDPDR